MLWKQLIGWCGVAAWLSVALAEDPYAAARRAAGQRPRVIFNNDGADARSFPLNREPTPEQLLRIRTRPWLGSDVTTLFYSTSWGTFSRFSHHTRAGQLVTPEEVEARVETLGRKDITLDLVAGGTDPLRVMVDFGREHGKEVFWSMRMNDTHDGVHRPDRPYFAFPRIKQEHPEWLVGRHDHRPPHGEWTAMDYARPEVRDLAFRYLEEVCRNYDVDGIELDFFRHGVLFRSTAWGGTASPREREALTGLIRRVYRMTEEVGRERGRPLLIAVRVPDSVGYGLDMGLDIERWAAEGLVDLFVMSGYFRLNDWAYSAAFGERHGVAVYAGLSETRVGGGHHAHRKRASRESYRGRALEAWNAGLDGIYIFNEYNAAAPYLSEIGDPESLARLHRLHFPAVRNRHPASWLANGNTHLNRRILTPDDPLLLRPGQQQQVTLWPGRCPDPEEEAGRPEVICHIQIPDLADPGDLGVTLNGQPLRAPVRSGEWLQYGVDPRILRDGANTVDLRLSETFNPPAEEAWTMHYQGDHLMRMPAQLPWRRLAMQRTAVEEVRDNTFYFADHGTGDNEMADLMYPWQVGPEDRVVVEARVRVEKSSAPRAVTVRVANGRYLEYLTLQEDRIGLCLAGLEHRMDTTAGFHAYRLVLDGRDIRVYVDDRLVLDGTGAWTIPANDQRHWLPLGFGLQYWNENSLLFGSASGPGTGAAYWEYLAYRVESPVVRLYDVILELRFDR